jgi:O-acetyl-ADP-ribose deacetylase (regulator of RNase III)
VKYIAFGDILNVESGTIVHGCNTEGVMGAGIAKQIKEKYPEAFEIYVDHLAQFKNKNDALGTICTYEVNKHLIIVNAITQLRYGRTNIRYVNYCAVQACFEQVCVISKDKKHNRINYPQIGAGLGGGDWSILSDIISTEISYHPHLDHTLWIYQE